MKNLIKNVLMIVLVMTTFLNYGNTKNKFENSEPKEDLSEIFLNFKDFGEINPN